MYGTMYVHAAVVYASQLIATALFRQGPSEFTVTGSLKTWDIRPELHNINVPTLLTNGVYDGASDAAVSPTFQAVSKVKWVTFSKSSHMPHWEERERYMQIVGDFLQAP